MFPLFGSNLKRSASENLINNNNDKVPGLSADHRNMPNITQNMQKMVLNTKILGACILMGDKKVSTIMLVTNNSNTIECYVRISFSGRHDCIDGIPKCTQLPFDARMKGLKVCANE